PPARRPWHGEFSQYPHQGTAQRMIWLLIALLLSPAVLFAQSAPAPAKVRAGAYYFDGWTGKSNHLTPRLRDEFFDREPVWGWRDDSLPVVERQIDCAA